MLTRLTESPVIDVTITLIAILTTELQQAKGQSERQPESAV
jgi:hypothetical protein